jgi:hypothetical protein
MSTATEDAGIGDMMGPSYRTRCRIQNEERTRASPLARVEYFITDVDFEELGGPGWDRTSDLGIMSPLL